MLISNATNAIRVEDSKFIDCMSVGVCFANCPNKKNIVKKCVFEKCCSNSVKVVHSYMRVSECGVFDNAGKTAVFFTENATGYVDHNQLIKNTNPIGTAVAVTCRSKVVIFRNEIREYCDGIRLNLHGTANIKKNNFTKNFAAISIHTNQQAPVTIDENVFTKSKELDITYQHFDAMPKVINQQKSPPDMRVRRVSSTSESKKTQKRHIRDAKKFRKEFRKMRSDPNSAGLPSMSGVRCGFCHNLEPKGVHFKKCGGCKRTQYCSVTCQRKDWKSKHKMWCQLLTDVNDGENVNSDVHFLA